MSLQCLYRCQWKCNRPPALLRLRLDQLQFAVHPLQGSANCQGSCRKVDIFPSEPQGFTLAQPNSQSHRVKCFEAVPSDFLKKFPRLLSRERLDFVCFNAGCIDQGGSVSCCQARAAVGRRAAQVAGPNGGGSDGAAQPVSLQGANCPTVEPCRDDWRGVGNVLAMSSRPTLSAGRYFRGAARAKIGQEGWTPRDR